MASSITIEDIELTRYVQSTFKIKAPGKVIWVDPIMVDAEQVGEDKADVVLLTHEHFDHFNVDSINACSKEGTVLVCNNSGIISKIQGNVSAAVEVMKEMGRAGCHGYARLGNRGLQQLPPQEPWPR